jgi:hypothetical protein
VAVAGTIEVRNDPQTGFPEDVLLQAPRFYAHIERMDDKHIWIRVTCGQGAVVFNLTSKSRINFTEER